MFPHQLGKDGSWTPGPFPIRPRFDETFPSERTIQAPECDLVGEGPSPATRSRPAKDEHFSLHFMERFLLVQQIVWVIHSDFPITFFLTTLSSDLPFYYKLGCETHTFFGEAIM